MRKRKRQKRLNWFPPAEAILECTLIQKPIYVLLKNRPPEVSLVACNGGGGPPSNISIASLNFASLSSPSSLANYCTFLISIWRLIMDLTQSTPTTVPVRRRRVLFLARLKDRKIFGLCFLCLSCDTHKLGGILGSRRWENLESLQDLGTCRCKRVVLLGCLI